MYHLRLVKGLSYHGVVSATKKQPDVYTEDKAAAEYAVATGYFVFVDTEEQPERNTGHLDKGQLEEMKLDDLKELAAEMGIDTAGLKKKADFVEAIAAERIEYDPAEDENEVDYGEGSPTMIELQKQ